MTIDMPEPTAEVVAAIIASTGMTEEQVRLVFAANAAVLAGDPVGTARKCPETGDIAVRFINGGIAMWHITPLANDAQPHNDMAPTLPWPTIGDEPVAPE